MSGVATFHLSEAKAMSCAIDNFQKGNNEQREWFKRFLWMKSQTKLIRHIPNKAAGFQITFNLLDALLRFAQYGFVGVECIVRGADNVW